MEIGDVFQTEQNQWSLRIIVLNMFWFIECVHTNVVGFLYYNRFNKLNILPAYQILNYGLIERSLSCEPEMEWPMKISTDIVRC